MSIKPQNLSDALFSKTRQSLLGLLYGHPDRDFYTNEIIRHTKIGSGTIQRELAQLSNVGLIVAQMVGNQKRYKANQASPLYQELRSITLKTFGLADILIDALKPLEDKICIAFIYGSIAKGTDSVNSDIDIMIIGDNLTYGDLFKSVTEAESTLERKVNPTFYTPREWVQKVSEKHYFVNKISNQPKIFLRGTEDELSKLR